MKKTFPKFDRPYVYVHPHMVHVTFVYPNKRNETVTLDEKLATRLGTLAAMKAECRKRNVTYVMFSDMEKPMFGPDYFYRHVGWGRKESYRGWGKEALRQYTKKS